MRYVVSSPEFDAGIMGLWLMSTSRGPQALEVCPARHMWPVLTQRVLDYVASLETTTLIVCHLIDSEDEQVSFSTDASDEPFAGFIVFDARDGALHGLVVKHCYREFRDGIIRALGVAAGMHGTWRRTLEIPDLHPEAALPAKLVSDPWYILRRHLSECASGSASSENGTSTGSGSPRSRGGR